MRVKWDFEKEKRADLFDFECLIQVTLVAVFEHQVNIVCCFFDIVELDDVVVITAFEDLDFVLQEFVEFPPEVSPGN